MKKKFWVPVFVLFLSLGFSSPGYCESDMWSKFGRGINNVVFFPFEIFYRPMEMREKGESWAIALAGGSLKGIGYAVGRLGVGLYETFTFPWPTPPDGNYEPIMLPEHMLQSD